MSVYQSVFHIQSDHLPTFHDVTDQVQAELVKSGVQHGLVTVYSQHTTCSVLIQEASHDRNYYGTEYLNQDLIHLLEKVAPTCLSEGQYMHPGKEHIAYASSQLREESFWSLNTDAHLRSVLIGRSESIPAADGELKLGQFGRIYFVDFDQVRARERTVWVQIIS